MLNGFKILEHNDVLDSLLSYRSQGAIRGVYLGFPQLHEHYTMSLPGVTDWTGYPQSGKSEMLLECLLNTSRFYGWKHLLYVPDVGDFNEAISILMHKLTGKTFDKRYEDKNYISENEVVKELPWIIEHFKFMYPIDPKNKMTPYQFWDYAAEQKNLIGVKTATIDSWKDMRHNIAPDGTGFSRDDKYLEDVLSYRNTMAELHKMHFHTVIHPRGLTEKDKDGNRKAPKPDDLKGGSEWWNNGKTMITIHRPDGSTNEVLFMVTKAKPKTVAKVGQVSMFFNVSKNAFYEQKDGKKFYADKTIIEQAQLFSDSDEDDDVPF